MPRASIVIPVYNVERYLPETLSSVSSQTFKDFEVICIDDGSQDSSPRILERSRQQDPRIQVVTQENLGVSAARNEAIRRASGDYIAFLDADDVMHPQFLELMLQAIEKTGGDFVWCDFQEIDDQEAVIRFPSYRLPPTLRSWSDVFDVFVARRPNLSVNLWNKLYRADLIRRESFPLGIRFGQDYIFIHQVISHAKSAGYLPATLHYYRRRVGSTTNSALSEKFIADRIAGLEILATYFKDRPLDPATWSLLERKLTAMSFRAACSLPPQRDRTRYRAYWTKFAPVLAELQTKGIYRPEVLNWRSRLKSNLFCHQMFSLLALVMWL